MSLASRSQVIQAYKNVSRVLGIGGAGVTLIEWSVGFNFVGGRFVGCRFVGCLW